MNVGWTVNRGTRRALGRLFWGLMLAAHTPAWLGTCGLLGPDGFDAARGFFLTLSQLLFVLKLTDVPWLRVSSSRRTWVTLTVSIALLHAGALQRLLVEQSATPPALPVGVTVTATVVAFACGVRRVLQRQAGAAVRSMRATWRAVRAQVLQAVLPPRHLLLTRAISVNRAPPA